MLLYSCCWSFSKHNLKTLIIIKVFVRAIFGEWRGENQAICSETNLEIRVIYNFLTTFSMLYIIIIVILFEICINFHILLTNFFFYFLFKHVKLDIGISFQISGQIKIKIIFICLNSNQNPTLKKKHCLHFKLRAMEWIIKDYRFFVVIEPVWNFWCVFFF